MFNFKFKHSLIAELEVSWVITGENVILIQFLKSEDQASVMLRFQEFYESPKFHKKFFTLQEYEEYYVSKYGKFSYSKDWAGFNVPHWSIEPFRDHNLNDFTKKEEGLIKLIDDSGLKVPYYVITTLKSDDDRVIEHEFAHALFTTNKEYRARVEEILLAVPKQLLKKIFKHFSDTEYHHDVITDEIQASLIDGYTLFEFIDSKGFTFDDKTVISEISKDLRRIFTRYMFNN